MKKRILLKYKQILSSDVVEINGNRTLMQRKLLKFQIRPWIWLCFNTAATHKSSKGGLSIFCCGMRPDPDLEHSSPYRWWLYLNGSNLIPNPTECSPQRSQNWDIILHTKCALDADTSPACLSINGWGRTALLSPVFIKKVTGEEVINAKTSLSETWVVLGVYQSHFSN